MRTLSLLVVLFFISHVTQASLLTFVDRNDNSHRIFQYGGVDYLSLAATAGMGVDEALTFFSGWSLASESQVGQAFDFLLPSYVPEQSTSIQRNCYSGQDCFGEAANWLAMLGETPHPDNQNVVYGFGLYQYGQQLRLAGARINYVLGQASLYGTNYTQDFLAYAKTNFADYSSVFLVRQSLSINPLNTNNVAAPTNIVLMGLIALFALLARRRYF